MRRNAKPCTCARILEALAEYGDGPPPACPAHGFDYVRNAEKASFEANKSCKHFVRGDVTCPWCSEEQKTDAYCSCETPSGTIRCTNCWLPAREVGEGLHADKEVEDITELLMKIEVQKAENAMLSEVLTQSAKGESLRIKEQRTRWRAEGREAERAAVVSWLRTCAEDATSWGPPAGPIREQYALSFADDFASSRHVRIEHEEEKKADPQYAVKGVHTGVYAGDLDGSAFTLNLANAYRHETKEEAAKAASYLNNVGAEEKVHDTYRVVRVVKRSRYAKGREDERDAVVRLIKRLRGKMGWNRLFHPQFFLQLVESGAHRHISDDDFNCCGGNDGVPPSHCSDCSVHPWVGSPPLTCITHPGSCPHATKGT